MCRGSSHLNPLPIELQRPLPKIDPDCRLWVFQESAPAESVSQTRLSHIGVTYYYDLKNPRLYVLMFVMRRQLQRVVQTENCVKLLRRFVYYCHVSSSRGLDVNSVEISR